MTSAQDPFAPAMQNFLQAGQTLAQHFMQYVANQKGFVPSADPAALGGASPFAQMPPELQTAMQAFAQIDMAAMAKANPEIPWTKPAIAAPIPNTQISDIATRFEIKSLTEAKDSNRRQRGQE